MTYFLVGAGPADLYPDGIFIAGIWLYVDHEDPQILVPVWTDEEGKASFSVMVPNLPGLTASVQFVPYTRPGYEASNALHVEIGP